jgi:cytochrome P450
MSTIELSNYRVCEKALMEPDLKQALYDEGAVLFDKVLVTLHGDEHRSRRILEMRVFRRNFFRHYEYDVIPNIFNEMVQPALTAGGVDVVEFGYRVMVNLAVTFAGIDRQSGSPEEFDDLIRMLKTFGRAATLGQSNIDRDAEKAKIAAAIKEFDEKFYVPSAQRRQGLIDQFNAGEIEEDDLPMDILTVLLRNEDKLELVRDLIVREVAYFFMVGAVSSVHSLGHAMHHLLTWCEEHPQDRQKLIDDTELTQRFVHESFRLHPSSPVSMRKALAAVKFISGETAEEGDTVIINLHQANRDATIFGDDAAEFNPFREIAHGVTETGITFGIGIHTCLGKNLAAGVLPKAGESVDPDRRQLGMVTWIAHALLKCGAVKDPENPGHIDPTITRETWAEYPILLPK